ncbi:MAG TPA: hypothetical protein VKB43_07190 [Gaiellaceae bacterium]|nr:hypothetical protein [Gaiellaceae bacterium]
MSSELERRLEAAFAEAPEPDPGAGEEALHRALRALQPAAPARRGLRTAVLAFAAIVVLLVIAAGSLAAAGALHISIGAKPKPHGGATQLALPKGANGVAAIVDGRLSVVTRDGLGFQGRPVNAAALSPRALYIAAGLGNSIVALAQNGRTAWSHPAGGKVVSIAWAPDGFRIAYVVDTGRHFVLHVIYGNGIHDTTIDRSVRPVRPSWRADSLALAYVGGGGRAIVYDLGHLSHQLVGTTAPVTRLAFAPVGRKLVVATPDAIVIGRKRLATGQIEALGWLGGLPAAAVPGLNHAIVRSFGSHGQRVDNFAVPGPVLGFSGGLVVVRTPTRILAGWGRAKTVNTLLPVRRSAAVEDVAIG